MAKGKERALFVCQQCGDEEPKWMGRCPACGAWNSLVETVAPAVPSRRQPLGAGGVPRRLPDVSSADHARVPLALSEFSRVMGGGIVPGSGTLIGGDPGIGKSTLLLQVSALIAQDTGTVLYVSGEESPQQIKLRADRLGIAAERLLLLAETSVDAIIGHLEHLRPALLVVDSIQTVALDSLTSAPGSVSQVKESAARLLQAGKAQSIPIFLVGHVTKEGAIAGPRVLEHIVDAVLYLEGERFHSYRLLRGVKNRFGSTNEVGLFEMGDRGMTEIDNPSEVFLAERALGTPGSSVAVTLEGTRPILVEIQALSSTTNFGLPRRTGNGIEYSRLLMLVAVLTKRVGLALANQDIYVNVVGGMKIGEPAADLGVAVSIASSFKSREVDPSLILIGEVGLSGELRGVGQLERRLAEAAKLGFGRAIHPRLPRPPRVPSGFETVGVSSLAQALEFALS